MCLVALMLLSGIHPATGALYRWVDEDGIVHFDETRPDNGQSVVKVDPGVKANPDEQDEVRENEAAEVELYVTSWCAYCKIAADFLRSRGIAFKQYDIEKNEDAARRRRALDPRPGVPFAVINGFRIRGFSVEGYEKALSLDPQEEVTK